MFDAVVIGGGPTGSRVAARLASFGHSAAVVEQRPVVGQKHCCTGIVSRECADYLRIPDEVVYRRVRRARVISPSGAALELGRPETQALVLNRSAFDRWLAQTAQSAGARYYFNFKARALSFSRSGVVVESEDGGQRLEAKAAVLASGFISSLVKNCGLGQPAQLVAGVQTSVRLEQVPEIEVYFDQRLAPDYFAWIVPTSEGRGLLGLLSNRSPAKRLQNWLEDQGRGGRVLPGGCEVHHWGIPLKPLRRTFSERLLVVGDAAGQAKPTTGGGLYFGLLSADLAAETLHNCAMRSDYSAASLSAYQRQWQARLMRELRLEYLARRLYRYLDNDRLERVLNRLKHSVRFNQLLQEDNLSFDWHGGLLLRAIKLGLADQVAGWVRKPARLIESLERSTQ